MITATTDGDGSGGATATDCSSWPGETRCPTKRWRGIFLRESGKRPEDQLRGKGKDKDGSVETSASLTDEEKNGCGLRLCRAECATARLAD